MFGVLLLEGMLLYFYIVIDRNISDFMVIVYINFVKFGDIIFEFVDGIKWRNF